MQTPSLITQKPAWLPTIRAFNRNVKPSSIDHCSWGRTKPPNNQPTPLAALDKLVKFPSTTKQRRRSYIHVQNRYSAAKPTPIAVKWSETVRGGGTHRCWCTRIQHELLFEPSPSQPLHEQQIEAEGRAKQSIRSETNQTLPFFPFPFQRRREEITCRYLFILVIS